jgi:CelD/BcsL family acetyltransferase involved in cellulose biosynthesis
MNMIRETMQISVIKDIKEAARMSEQWNELLTYCSASHVPFLRFEYLNSWWEHLGGGEWTNGELLITCARRENGELVGIAPLFYTHNLTGDPALMLIGSIEISDYLDFIVRKEDIDEFTLELLKYLDNLHDPEWRFLDLYNLPESSPTVQALKTAANKLNWGYHEKRLQPCPYIPLKGDWEAYLLGIDKKQRHEIRRKIRRAEESETPVRWYIVEEAETLDQEISDFLALMGKDPNKARFLVETMQKQMRSIIHAAFEAGWLQLAFLTIGDQKAACYLNFDFAGYIWVYNSGLDNQFRDFSPGWVLLGYLLQWAIDNNRPVFDLMRGSEDYKYRFGGIDRYIVRACLDRGQ